MAMKRPHPSASIHWSATTIRWAKRAGRCLPIINGSRQTYRDDHLEHRRTAEPGRAQYRRRALRDAAGDGRARRPHAGTPIRFRSAAPPDIPARPGVESVCAASLRAAEDGLRRLISVHRRSRVRSTRLPARGCRAFSPQRRASCGARGDKTHARGRGIRRQRHRGCSAPGGRSYSSFGSLVARDAAPDVYVRRADRTVGGGHARPAGRRTRVVGRGSGDLCRVGLAPQPASSRRGVLARRTRRTSRVCAARIRHPLSGLSLRVGRPVLETRIVAARDSGGRIRGHSDVRRSVNGVRAIRAERSAGK